MKWRKDKWNKIVNQLRRAHCLVRYCQNIGKEFWSKADFLGGYGHRYISIGQISIAKRPTRITKAFKSNDSPEKAIKINRTRVIQFDQIAE
ncbi:MAG: hypothetical protein OXF60_07665 [Gammaproteobacteria bacterium]|nr:hypothetical protein [Gammaproteobacteria bacterium]MCY4219692.1 hypothetical protein [Gammaproteobacteria bacterium]